MSLQCLVYQICEMERNSIFSQRTISKLAEQSKKSRNHLTTASINSFPHDIVRFMSGTNSFVSYLRRIHDSFSSRGDCAFGLFKLPMFASYTEFDSELPIDSITLKCDVCRSSRPSDRTLLMCEPRFRWMPEHSMQIKMPKLFAMENEARLIDLSR